MKCSICNKRVLIISEGTRTTVNADKDKSISFKIKVCEKADGRI